MHSKLKVIRKSNFEFSIARQLFISQEHKTIKSKEAKGMTNKRTMKTQPAYFWNGPHFPSRGGEEC